VQKGEESVKEKTALQERRGGQREQVGVKKTATNDEASEKRDEKNRERGERRMMVGGRREARQEKVAKWERNGERAPRPPNQVKKKRLWGKQGVWVDTKWKNRIRKELKDKRLASIARQKRGGIAHGKTVVKILNQTPLRDKGKGGGETRRTIKKQRAGVRNGHYVEGEKKMKRERIRGGGLRSDTQNVRKPPIRRQCWLILSDKTMGGKKAELLGVEEARLRLEVLRREKGQKAQVKGTNFRGHGKGSRLGGVRI